MEDIGSYDEWVDVADRERDEAMPHFYMRAKQHKADTEKEGRAIFHQVPYVKILVPGDNKNIVDRPVKDEHKKRWPRLWQRFEETQSNVIEGTPIDQWPFLNVAQVAEMKAMNIQSVEQLANLSDGGLEKIGMGARALQKRAQDFLKPAGENEKSLREENAELKQRMAEMEAKLEQAINQPKRTRRTKAEMEAAREAEAA